MSSGRHSNDGVHKPAHSSEIETSREAVAPTDHLGQVLNSTFRSAALGGGDSDDLAAFRETARRLGKQAFSCDPVAVELVLAALRRQFDALGVPDASLRAATQQVATALCDDPPSRTRLEKLWHRLCEESS